MRPINIYIAGKTVPTTHEQHVCLQEDIMLQIHPTINWQAAEQD
jgi:hypothetical protein